MRLVIIFFIFILIGCTKNYYITIDYLKDNKDSVIYDSYRLFDFLEYENTSPLWLNNYEETDPGFSFNPTPPNRSIKYELKREQNFSIDTIVKKPKLDIFELDTSMLYHVNYKIDTLNATKK